MTETELWKSVRFHNEIPVYLDGATHWFGWYVTLYALINGQWAYMLNRGSEHQHGGRAWGYRLQGPFDSPQQAIAAAEAERYWLEAGGRDV